MQSVRGTRRNQGSSLCLQAVPLAFQRRHVCGRGALQHCSKTGGAGLLNVSLLGEFPANLGESQQKQRAPFQNIFHFECSRTPFHLGGEEKEEFDI